MIEHQAISAEYRSIDLSFPTHNFYSSQNYWTDECFRLWEKIFQQFEAHPRQVNVFDVAFSN